MKPTKTFIGLYQPYVSKRLSYDHPEFRVEGLRYVSMVSIDALIVLPIYEPVDVIRRIDELLTPLGRVRDWEWIEEPHPMAGCMRVRVVTSDD